jgi:hypothetical protein
LDFGFSIGSAGAAAAEAGATVFLAPDDLAAVVLAGTLALTPEGVSAPSASKISSVCLVSFLRLAMERGSLETTGRP